MEAKVQKHIVDYFAFFEEFYNKARTCLKDCQSCAVTINKLIKRCNNVKEAELKGTPLEEYSSLQTKLCTSLYNLISEEIHKVRSNLNNIENLLEKLFHKQKLFLESCKDLNFEEKTLLIKGSPLQPPLQQLIEFAEDSITFASQIHAQIETSLNVLSLRGLQTEIPVENFKISSIWQETVSEIIAYTSFCSENQI